MAKFLVFVYFLCLAGLLVGVGVYIRALIDEFIKLNKENKE